MTPRTAFATLSALMLAGCSSLLGLSPPTLIGDANGDGDSIGSLDVIHDVPCTTFSTEVDTCQLDFSSATAIDLSGAAIYDSDSHILTVNGAPAAAEHVRVTGPAGPIEVVLATTFSSEVGSTFTLQGTVPVAVVATGAIQIDGLVTVLAGARLLADCAPLGGVNGTPDNSGGGGGGGGAYQGNGGAGGNGDGNAAPGGAGETSAAVVGLLGGCPGGNGGNSANVAPSGGVGGGAVDFASAVSYTQSSGGEIQAGGAGGLGGPVEAGASGGGSGGMILIEAPSVTITGPLAANGGGGGGGGGGLSVGHDGTPGGFGNNQAQGGPQGSGNGAGSSGGRGGSANKADGESVGGGAIRGGGGGGGGVGYIAIACASPVTAGASISPALTSWPP